MIVAAEFKHFPVLCFQEAHFSRAGSQSAQTVLSKLKAYQISTVRPKSAHLRQFVVLLCCGSKVFRFKTTITVSFMGTLHNMTSAWITQSRYLTGATWQISIKQIWQEATNAPSLSHLSASSLYSLTMQHAWLLSKSILLIAVCAE